ncbi:hypothetical protein ACHAQA_001396 [Verticillium albo-atrum]
MSMPLSPKSLKSTAAPLRPSPKGKPGRHVDPSSSDWQSRSPEDFKIVGSSRNDFLLDHVDVHKIYTEFHKAEPSTNDRRDSTEWLLEFVKDQNIKPRDLHEVALRTSDLGLLTTAEFESQYRMHDAAGELGHVPATLHIIRMILFGKNPEILPRFRPRAYARFKSLVAEGRNPDALTLQGKFHALRDERELAAEMFRRAKAVAGPDGEFQWRSICQIELAKLHEARGARDEACRVYRELVEVKDAEGCYYLATLDGRMPGATPLVAETEVRELLTRAAMAGYPPAATALADLETSRYDRAVTGGDEAAAGRHLLDAQEWRKIAAAWKVGNPKDYSVY